MKLFALLTAIIVFLNACNQSLQPKNDIDKEPKAFEDKKLSLEIVSKSRGEDILDKLYAELVDKNVELQKLESKIDAFYESKRDTTEAINLFDSRNFQYYADARQSLNVIKDSLLRKRIEELINLSNKRYDGLMFENKALLKQVESKSIVLNDIHAALKVVSTLPVIEKYQKGYLPDSKPLQGLLKQADEVTNETEAFLKRAD